MSMTFEYPYGDAPRAHAAARRPTPACPPDSSVLDQYEAVGEEGENLFFLPLIIPEELADNSDLWIGATG